jgi:hypothetical protein
MLEGSALEGSVLEGSVLALACFPSLLSTVLDLREIHPTMTTTKANLLAAAGMLLVTGAMASTAMADGPLPSLDSGEVAQGPFSRMHMVLQKTLLKINVATIDVRVDKGAQSRLAGLGRGQAYSDGLAQQLAHVTISAEHAVVQMQFMRDISLSRWMGVVRDSLEQARSAGLITPDLEKRVSQGLPQWFASIKDRGYLKGDKLIYAIGPDSLRTVVVATSGQVLIDRQDNEQGARRVVLASYFAPGSDFREPLLRSLLGSNP